jgi:hypothetical protein
VHRRRGRGCHLVPPTPDLVKLRVQEVTGFCGKQFSATRADGFTLRARKVLLTTGLTDEVPRLDGIERLHAPAKRYSSKAMFFTTSCRQSSDLSTSLGCLRDEKGGT